MNISFSRLGDLFVANLKANSKIYGMGDSRRMSIGNMIRVHQKLLNIRIIEQAKIKRSFWQALACFLWREKILTEIIVIKEKQISVQLKDNPKIIGYGKSIDDAVGSLIIDNDLSITLNPQRVNENEMNYFASFQAKKVPAN
ncbi:MAG: hypothetical protein NTX00_03655 [Candidatus Parcubacteria bacterium]|nr:hypothetical protein [Candidatus Parcubacteria bacterium]